MYTVSTNRPFTSLMTKTRRGITQKVDPVEPISSNRDACKSGTINYTADVSSPKPIFHQVNGRRSQIHRTHHENFPPQYDELIKYIHDTWTGIHNEFESSKQVTDGKVPKIVYYQDSSTSSNLTNFEPFDLESFWGERLLRNIQQST